MPPPPPPPPPPRRSGSNGSSSSLDDTAAALLAQRGLALVSCTPVQSLWAGYGHVCAVAATGPGGVPVALVLKSIAAPPPAAGAGADDEGHRRKMLSYRVERHFYARLAPRLPARVAVARCLASSTSSTSSGSSDGRRGASSSSSALLLRDLRVPWPRGLRLLPRADGGEDAADDDDDDDKDEDEVHEAADAAAFPLALEKRGVLPAPLVTAALDWLAGFHGHFWGRRDGDGDGRRRPVLDEDRASLVRPPLQQQQSRANDDDDGVGNIWLNGGYTYLATRRREYASLEAAAAAAAAAGRGGRDDDDDDEWGAALCAPGRSGRAVAEEVAEFLAPATDGGGGAAAEYETVIHGDVKSENMFGTTDRSPSSSSSSHAAHAAVAFFDFQYVGLGLGVCDLAKLFTCSVPLAQLLGGDDDDDDADVPRELDMQAGERALLQHYVRTLEGVAGKRYPWDVFARHWEAALVDWLRFQASWAGGFWGNTEWLKARVRFILKRRPSPWP